MTAALERGVSGQQHAPAVLYPRERLDSHFTVGCVGPRVGLDRCGKSRPHRDWIPDRPARSQSLYLLRYPAHKNCTYVQQNILKNNGAHSRTWWAAGPPFQSKIKRHALTHRFCKHDGYRMFFATYPSAEISQWNRLITT